MRGVEKMPSSFNWRILKEMDYDTGGSLRLSLRDVDPSLGSIHRGLTVGDAERVAAQIIGEAEESAAAIRERAYREGIEQGAKEGRVQVEEAARKMVERMKELLREIEAERAAVLTLSERELVELSLEISKRIVAAELKVNQEVVVAIAKEALTLIRDRPYVLALVHPDDFEICNQARQQFEALLPEGAVLRILPDIKVERGGCVLDTGQGVVDATLDSRWAALMEALKG